MSLLFPSSDAAAPFRRGLVVLLLIPLLFLAGCDDPSNVGQGLLDAQSNNTQVISLTGASLESVERGDLTGGNTALGSVRALFGQVDDPIIGPWSSRGFVDFVPGSQFDTAFLSGNVSWADLKLNIDYRYGDTTSVLEMDLYSVPQAWQSTQLRADSVIATGSFIGTYDIPAATGVVTLPLPASWVSQNDAVLRSSDFADDFHGFALLPRNGNVVLGARFSASELRASAVPGDTVSYPMSKVGTLTDDSSVEAPAGQRILHDGGTRSLDLRLPISGEQLGEGLIHRVILKLTTTDWSAQYPDGFLHPLPGVISVAAVSSDGGTRLEIAEVTRNTDGVFIVDGTTLTNVFQSANLGKSVLDRFEISIPNGQSGVGFVSFAVDAASSGVETLVTLTPIN
ncbi:MAG: hypothetical protein O2899_03575 [Bacteroidetes bacterium]|nr:hypothetical protein [Bacteroidota bacterium]